MCTATSCTRCWHSRETSHRVRASAGPLGLTLEIPYGPIHAALPQGESERFLWLSDRWSCGGLLRVDQHVIPPRLWQVFLCKDCSPSTLRSAGASIDADFRVDDQHAVPFAERIDRAHFNAATAFAAGARSCDNVCHARPPSVILRYQDTIISLLYLGPPRIRTRNIYVWLSTLIRHSRRLAQPLRIAVQPV